MLGCSLREFRDANCIVSGLQVRNFYSQVSGSGLLLGSVSFFSNILETEIPFWRDLETLHDHKPYPVFLDDSQKKWYLGDIFIMARCAEAGFEIIASNSWEKCRSFNTRQHSTQWRREINLHSEETHVLPHNVIRAGNMWFKFFRKSTLFCQYEALILSQIVTYHRISEIWQLVHEV